VVSGETVSLIGSGQNQGGDQNVPDHSRSHDQIEATIQVGAQAIEPETAIYLSIPQRPEIGQQRVVDSS